MLKIWKGIEQEFTNELSKVMTMFVCSDKVIDGATIIRLLIQNKDIKSIYFGAGRVRFVGVYAWKTLIEYCHEADISISIELFPEDYRSYICQYSDDVVTFILSYYNMPTIDNIRFKTDDWHVVSLYEKKASIDIDSVKDGMYPDDIIIYSEV